MTVTNTTNTYMYIYTVHLLWHTAEVFIQYYIVYHLKLFTYIVRKLKFQDHSRNSSRADTKLTVTDE